LNYSYIFHPILSSPAYIFAAGPRTKAASVIFSSRASDIPELSGEALLAMIGILARAAFSTIISDRRPVVRRADLERSIPSKRKKAFGRMASVLRSVEGDLLFLGEARDRLRKLPTIDLDLPTIIIAGYPNVGKSSFLAMVTSAKPQVAAYPFTTLHPCLGIMELSKSRRLVLADIPGLISGAHAGAGLGNEFLRHVERTRLLVHMLDICPPEGDPAENYRVIRRELSLHSPALAAKTEIVVANKMDLTGGEANLRRLRKSLGDVDIIPISAVTGKGLDPLKERLWKLLAKVE